MEEILQKILDNHAGMVEKYKNKSNALISRMNFCQAHNFKEEERIARVEFDAMDMLRYNYENLYNEVREALNKWQF